MGVGMGLGQQGRLEMVYLFIFYFCILFMFGGAGPPLPRGLSLVTASEGYFLSCIGFALRWLLLWSMGSRLAGFSSLVSQVLERRLNSCDGWV